MMIMSNNNLEYKFVIIGASGYYEFGYHDVMNHPNVIYHSSYLSGIRGRLKQELVKLNFSRKINQWFHYPLSACVNPIMFPHPFSKTDKICFLFFESHFMIYYSPYIQYLRRNYPNCKIVLFLQDILGTKKEIDVNKIKGIFDLIVSYDKGNSDEYGLLYHPTPMSFVDVADDTEIKNSDVYFCGKAKSRYPLIHRIYNELTARELVCDFNIIDMPDGEERIPGINYLPKGFSYQENIQHIQKTKCILEIMQEGATGYTPRLWESIIYDKALLTNNISIYDSEYYYPENMIICSGDAFDVEAFGENINKAIRYDISEKQDLSPVNLLIFIQSYL